MFVALRAVEASVSTSDVSRDFYGHWAVGDRYYWWLCQIMVDPQEVIVEDPDGDLYRMSYTPNADGTVSFGDPSRVRVEYVDVAAKAETNQAILAGIVQVRGANVLARFTSRQESRLSTQEGESMREHIARMRRKLGLSAETPDEEVLRQAADQVDGDEEEADNGGTQQPVPPTPPAGPGEPPPASPPTPPAAPGATPPPATPGQGGTTGGSTSSQSASNATSSVTVDAAALAQLQRDAQVGVAERNARLAREDQEYVATAVRVGKIPPSSIPSLVAEMSRSEDSRLATRQYLDGLAENVIPVATRSNVEGTNTTVEGHTSQVEAFMALHMPDVVQRKRRLQTSGIPRVSGDGSRLPAGTVVD